MQSFVSDNSIDDEWMNYLKKYDNNNNGRIVSLIDTEIIKMKNCVKIADKPYKEPVDIDTDNISLDNLPKENLSYDLNISTKTKILYLNQPIDIHSIFWEIPIIDYWRPMEGVVKKQIKVVSKTPEEYEQYREKLKSIRYYTENIIKEINNPTARSIKFKNEVKITVGISRKDIMNCRGKVKHAFYNCFAIIIRLKYEDVFREIHVKVFNTGKMEIPGINNSSILDIVKKMILNIVQPFVKTSLDFTDNGLDDNVLINSNFNCGYFINREILHSILRSPQYGIEAAYDPCSYPGVKCKFYFNNDIGFDYEFQKGHIIKEDSSMKMSELDDNKKYTEVSFMIFRTGSVLIVGNCSDNVLLFIFEFIKKMLIQEKPNIYVSNEEVVVKNKKVKLRKRNIKLTQQYFDKISTTATITGSTSGVETPAPKRREFL